MSHAPRLDYPRLDYHRLCPAAFKAYLAFEHATEQACLEPGLAAPASRVRCSSRATL